MATAAPTPNTPEPGPGNFPDKQPVPVLDRRNVEYELHADEYNMIDLLYEGGQRLKNNGQNILMKRPKELYDVYQERYRRLTYQNILQACLGWYLAKLYQREPLITSNTTDPRFTAFLQDCDRAGTTYVDFSRRMIETQILYRRAFVFVDKP